MKIAANKEVVNPLLAEAIQKAKNYPVHAKNEAGGSNYNDGGTYGDGYGDANYGDQSYGEGPAG